MGYNMYKVFTNLSERGYGTGVLYTGLRENLFSKLSFLGIRNTVYFYLYDKNKPKKITNDLMAHEKAQLSGISAFIATIFTNGLEC